MSDQSLDQSFARHFSMAGSPPAYSPDWSGKLDERPDTPPDGEVEIDATQLDLLKWSLATVGPVLLSINLPKQEARTGIMVLALPESKESLPADVMLTKYDHNGLFYGTELSAEGTPQPIVLSPEMLRGLYDDGMPYVTSATVQLVSGWILPAVGAPGWNHLSNLGQELAAALPPPTSTAEKQTTTEIPSAAKTETDPATQTRPR